jgi:IS30 family transposase
MWGLDAVGPFRTASGGYKHILVVVEKFTKWIEVRPVVEVTSGEAVKFIGDIKHRFGVPSRIIIDLGKAFTSLVFWDFCQDNLINVYYSSVTHPRCNGQVERANGMVLQALKDSIYDDASNYATRWVSELKSALLRDFRPSFWFMDQKLYYLPMSLLEPHGSSSTRKERPSKHSASTSTASKNKDSLPS